MMWKTTVGIAFEVDFRAKAAIELYARYVGTSTPADDAAMRSVEGAELLWEVFEKNEKRRADARDADASKYEERLRP